MRQTRTALPVPIIENHSHRKLTQVIRLPECRKGHIFDSAIGGGKRFTYENRAFDDLSGGRPARYERNFQSVGPCTTMSTSPTAYRVYVLKRLGFERARGEVQAEAFGELCRAVLEKHVMEGYADPDLRKAAIMAANIAIVDVCSRMDDPSFDLNAALTEAEAALAAERASAERAVSARSTEESAPREAVADVRGTAARPSASASIAASPPSGGGAAGPATSRDGGRPKANHVPAPGPAGSAAAGRPAGQGPIARRGWIAAATAGAIAGGVAGFMAGFFAGDLSGSGRGASLAPVVGDWTWMGGAQVRFIKNGSFTFNGRPAGHYFATSARHFILIHDNGRFVDYVTLDSEGRTLTGYSAAGVPINATRVR